MNRRGFIGRTIGALAALTASRHVKLGGVEATLPEPAPVTWIGHGGNCVMAGTNVAAEFHPIGGYSHLARLVDVTEALERGYPVTCWGGGGGGGKA